VSYQHPSGWRKLDRPCGVECADSELVSSFVDDLLGRCTARCPPAPHQLSVGLVGSRLDAPTAPTVVRWPPC